MKISQQFLILRQDISGTEPTVEQCRDWCESLASLCEDLAILAEGIEEGREDAR